MAAKRVSPLLYGARTKSASWSRTACAVAFVTCSTEEPSPTQTTRMEYRLLPTRSPRRSWLT
eukprot:7390005-Prymnesium_polylepis.1